MAFVEEPAAAYTVEGFNHSLFNDLPVDVTFEKNYIHFMRPTLPIPEGGESGDIDFHFNAQFNRMMFDVAQAEFRVRKYSAQS